MKTLKNILPHLLYILLGGSCGIFMVSSFAGDLSNKLAFFGHIGLTALVLILAFFVQTVIHEGGHLVFGLLTGYKFQSFRIANFLFIKENGKLRVKLYSVPGTGGQCLMFPPEGREKLPFRLYNLGGCLANLITGVLFLLGYYFLYPEYGFALFFGALGIFGIADTFLNGIPMKLNGIANDGYNTLGLSKSEEARRAFWIQLSVAGNVMNGLRFRDMPAEWFYLPDGKALESALICTVGVFKYSYDFDIHNLEEAERDIEYMLKAPGLLGLHKNELLCELLFLRVFFGAPEEDIDSLFTRELRKYLKATENYVARRRLWYAYHLLYKKDEAAAAKALAAFEESAKAFAYSADTLGEIETVEMIKEKAAL